MAQESGSKFDKEKSDRDLRIDCALTSVAQRTDVQDYKIALVSKERTLTTVVYRNGVGISVNVNYAPVDSSRGAREIQGYSFEVEDSGWVVSETLRLPPESDPTVVLGHQETTEEYVALLEDVINHSTVVGFEATRPLEDHRLKAVGTMLWKLASKVVIVGETQLKTWFGARK